MKKFEKKPDWFWSRGLHDAEVLSIEEKETLPDYSKPLPVYNYLSIKLDAEHAMFEHDITEIRFFNYKLKGFEAKLPTEFPMFWMCEDLEQISENRFEIKIELTTVREKHKFIHLTFQSAQVFKKR